MDETSMVRFIDERSKRANAVSKHYLLANMLGKLRFRRDLVAHYSCVNAVTYGNHGRVLLSAGDDTRVLVWPGLFSNDKVEPLRAFVGHESNIFGLMFAEDNVVYSCSNDTRILGWDLEQGPSIFSEQFCGHRGAVFRLSKVDDHSFLSASQDGTIRLWDRRSKSVSGICRHRREAVFSCNYVDAKNNLFCSASNVGVRLWDLRSAFDGNPSPVFRYSKSSEALSAMFDSSGSRIVVSLTGRCPKIFSVSGKEPIATLFSEDYENTVTMKSCLFFENRVFSGSDDHNVYVWRADLPLMGDPDSPSIILPEQMLEGHESIVNSIAVNPVVPEIATCGIEKIVKIFSAGVLPKEPVEEEEEEEEVEDLPESFSDWLSTFLQTPEEEEKNESVDKNQRTLDYFELLRIIERHPPDSSTSSDDDGEAEPPPIKRRRTDS